MDQDSASDHLVGWVVGVDVQRRRGRNRPAPRPGNRYGGLHLVYFPPTALLLNISRSGDRIAGKQPLVVGGPSRELVHRADADLALPRLARPLLGLALVPEFQFPELGHEQQRLGLQDGRQLLVTPVGIHFGSEGEPDDGLRTLPSKGSDQWQIGVEVGIREFLGEQHWWNGLRPGQVEIETETDLVVGDDLWGVGEFVD